jgi:hypothetical protein
MPMMLKGNARQLSPDFDVPGGGEVLEEGLPILCVQDCFCGFDSMA